jgi:MFS family permease
MLGLCICISAFAVNRDFHVGVVLAALVGSFNFALMTTLNSTLQYLVDDARRGRVMSLYLVSWGGLVPIGGLLIGLLAHLLGPASAMLIFSTVAALFAVVTGIRHRTESLPAYGIGYR